MRAQDAQLFHSYQAAARAARAEAETAFEKERTIEGEYRMRREALPELRCQEATAREQSRREQEACNAAEAEAEASRERVQEVDRVLLRLDEDSKRTQARAERIRTQLRGRVDQELDLADRAAMRASERLRAYRETRALRAREQSAAEKKAGEARTQAEAARAEARRLAALYADLERELSARHETLTDLRVASRSAMSKAWSLSKTVEGWRAAHGVP